MFSMRSMLPGLFLGLLGVVCVAISNAKLPLPASESIVQDGGTGPQHERLMKLAGKYTSSSKMTMAGKAMPETTGEATFTSILGGRFLLQEEKGTMMGQPFDTRKMYGFNGDAKKYEGVWVYTGATAMMNLSGTSKDDGKTISFAASYEGADGKMSPFEIVMTDLGADKLSIVMKSKEGEQVSTIETIYTRKK